MYPSEYYSAKQKIGLQKNIVKKFNLGTKGFEREFKKFIELIITVHGHSLCMDLASERKKISKLVTSAVIECLK